MSLLALALLTACSEEPAPPPPASMAAPVPAAAVEPPPPDPVTVRAGTVAAGPFTIAPVLHGTAMIVVAGKTWWIDPWSQAPLEGRPKADVILLTDLHPDHLDPAALQIIAKPDAHVVAPSAVDQAWQGTVHTLLANGQSADVAGVRVTAVPMYNRTRGPAEGELYHEKGRGNGYLLEAEGTRVYFAGDTACTEEMRALTDIDLAFVPMNLPYTMPPEEAAECVRAFQPAAVAPYHYRGSDTGVFRAALEGQPGLMVLDLDFYPG